ncbi:hypothetical protein KIN20_030825 [Parelaphostrongylus tenuis]|uniref:Uncharacterized protein n=1 Tax=Parelaphostrongylus tenuis TaxID=148309 RepID=A0AAD5WH60_PARTN|nr:hypothetical protein KIN20_030825 [Parelaphostrongylus tenuis]
MAGLPTDPIVISLFSTILTVFGCGVIPAGQASTRNFVVTGFTLPVAMAYSTAIDVRASVPGIAASRDGARAFVSRLVMQTVFDILERSGRNALLPDAVISSILGQLNFMVIYDPIQCQKFFSGPMAAAATMMKENCIIVDNTVTGICTVPTPAPGNMMCNVNVAVIPPQHLTIGGLISTTNTILASWSRTMWQSVLNRAVQMLASGPFKSNFASASAVISGN